jgi:hypothetical protein
VVKLLDDFDAAYTSSATKGAILVSDDLQAPRGKVIEIDTHKPRAATGRSSFLKAKRLCKRRRSSTTIHR